MNPCTSCRQRAVPAAAPAPLLQIRRGYRTRWNNLVMSVETDSSQWTLRVQDCGDGRTLYTAYRGGVAAAQAAAVEFAIFRLLGPSTAARPDRLARELSWQEYW